MTNGINYAAEFVNRLDLSQKAARLEERLKKETREEERKKIQEELDSIAYHVVVQNKDKIHDVALKNTIMEISPKEFRENHEELYKMGHVWSNEIPLERVNRMFKNNLEDIAANVPNEKIERIALTRDPETEDNIFEKALGDDELVKEYKEVLDKLKMYLFAQDLVREYKEKGKFDDEKMAKAFYSIIAEDIGEHFAGILKGKGYSERAQNIGKSISALAAAAGLAGDENVVKRSADAALKREEKKFRDYETEKGKKAVDYARKGLKKLSESKSTDHYNAGRNLLYSVAKEYVRDEKLEAEGEDLYKLLAA